MAFPNDKLKQTAVYWASPVDDGYGGMDWGDPIEIDCRWVNTNEVVTSKDGQQILCRAAVQVDQDLDENGLLFLGTLDDLDSEIPPDPATIDGAYRIRAVDKTPTLDATEFYRMVWL